MLTPKTRYHLLRIFQFVFLWIVFGMLYAIVEFGLIGYTGTYPTTQNIYDPADSFLFIFIGTTLLGLLIGLIETFGINEFFKNTTFFKKIVLKSVVYLLIIIFFLITLSFISTSSILNTSVFDPIVISYVQRFVTNMTFITIILYIGVIFIFILFFAEIRDNLGLFTFANFLTGKYHQPRVEDRIFMFMDMKSSTTIAEELGHIKYYDLLNKYYSDMSDAIINTHGEIYQYVGDEVIISWPLKEGLQNNNCIRCYYEIKLSIIKKESDYMALFGRIPKFKAALHCGQVTTGEIGKLKKEIVFTGDVLNTTSRIQDRCNEFKSELLVSSALLNLLPRKEQLNTEKIGQITLKGKNQQVEINKVALSF